MGLFLVVLDLERLEEPYDQLEKFLHFVGARQVTHECYLVTARKSAYDLARHFTSNIDRCDSVLVVEVTKNNYFQGRPEIGDFLSNYDWDQE